MNKWIMLIPNYALKIKIQGQMWEKHWSIISVIKSISSLLHFHEGFIVSMSDQMNTDALLWLLLVTMRTLSNNKKNWKHESQLTV